MEQRILISDVGVRTVLRDSSSLFRRYQSRFLERFGPELRGRVVELGGELKYGHGTYFPNATKYLITNVAREHEQFVDITSMPFDDGTQDAFVCVSVLAHVPDFRAGLTEIWRTLRPGGQLLLTTPFLFPVTDEKDYWRFSRDALPALFGQYDIRVIAHLGGRISTVVDLLQRPKGRYDRRSLAYKSLALLVAGTLGHFDTIDGYSLGFGIHAVKP